jgi:hypothetical protein
MQVVTCGVIDAILLWLALKDRRSGSGIRVFEFMFAVFAVTQAPTFILHRQAWWPRFAEWLAALPLP